LNSLKNISWKDVTKYKWALYVLLIIFTAKTVSDILVTYIDHSLTPLVRVRKKPKRLPFLRPPDVDNILAINIFNPSYKAPVLPGADSFATAIPTRFKIKLAGTLVFEDSKRSYADLLMKGEKESLTVQESTIILGNSAKIIKIQYDRVYILNMKTQGYEYIAMPLDENDKPTSTRTSRGAGVRATNGTTFQIDRSVIRNALNKDNIAKTITDASSRFEVVGGRIVGVRITSVRPGSFYEKHLDIRRDDVLEEVNGQKIDSLKAGTALFEQLRANIDDISQPITLTIMRNGRRIVKTYTVK